MSLSSELIFYVNGKKVVEEHADPETTLLYYLRNKLRLTGTKLGCGEGGCGACTVMLSKYDSQTKTINHFSANACLAPLCAMHGLAVTTVEGIGSVQNGLHPVQERIAKSHGSQCGFCTPGIVMSMYTLLRNNPMPEKSDMESAFEGNLCRCTGYRPILEGFKTFTKEYCQMGEKCCRNNSQPMCNGVNENGNEISTELFSPSEFLPLDNSQDPIFPPELMRDTLDGQSLIYKGERATWYRPTTLAELVELKSTYPNAKLVIGNTEIGVEQKLKNMHYPVMIAATHVAELNKISCHSNGVTFGASVTLTQIEHTLKEIIQREEEYKVRMYQAVVEILRWFAGHQIRNVAAIAGNIITASPISDLNPLFLASGAKLNVISKVGERSITMDKNFFVGYRKTVVKPEEVVVSVTLPHTQEDEYFGGYKQANRREDDIAIVNAGIRVMFEPKSNVIKQMALAFGGMSITTVMAAKAMKNAVGRIWDDDFVMDMSQWLMDDLPLPAGAPGGMTEYRKTLCTSFFFKFYLTVQMQLQKMLPDVVKSKVPPSYQSATPTFHRDPSKSTQMYEEVPPGQPEIDPMGKPIPHLSGAKQASGEAIYVDDMPKFQDELYLALVTSSKAHAKIVSLDPSAALKMPGVVSFICHKDIPGYNKWGAAIPDDEEIFASKEVTCMGQIIGAVIADNQVHAQRAAKSVKVEYEALEEIITIKDAIKKNSFYDLSRSIKKGNVGTGFEISDHVIEGDVSVGGQEHFYLETHTTLALPKNEDGEMELFVSTQNPTETQMVVGSVLGVDYNRIVCRVKRMGGGFGGKETRSIPLSAVVAVAAAKLKVPVRCMLDRDEDMLISGARHPFYGKYKVGFTKEGKILALECDIYNNCGNSVDLSAAVMERALFHSENAYYIPNVRVTGHLCKTNIPSNTAFRGFGGPQGMMICESWIEQIASALEVSPTEIRDMNLYKEGDLTHYNQPLENCTIRRCWDECVDRSEYLSRRKDVDIFNSENRWKKRGISVVPVKFGIAFTFLPLNQAGALVMIYRDGSVLLTHGGTEMGQGLHTKMIQVASRTLRIPASKIHITETSTNTVPNTSATAASASSDLNGMAIMNACETLLSRLDPIIRENPKGTWEDWVKTAYMSRISLSATGFYRTPDIGYDFVTNSGKPFNYFTYGVACSEVEIDCLTGDHQVLRTDIVMDIGISINPAIDIGQIEGGFIQGYGMMMLEAQKMSPNGFLFTRGPGNYKIPGFGDIPVEFNVSLLKGSVNNRAVYSSKAIGEPPLFLSASVFFAVKDAISSARSDARVGGFFKLDSPATPERIRMACKDQFTQMFPEAKEGTYTPWFVQL